ncbi:MAG: SMP-30/Gluconolaconase/LRE domain protein [Naasia sp.]|jgi:D-xylonolactonase|uniref:SMP-30/gluconolactonase/LRE family protein n=1 Tax=Naasia sp. TaxID=2546198 RepID=UPI00263811D8|nr:SMP-30/gluconolactonase/LRE family protein [Naasia sp.]MCU1570888.1 SMP-30/Gluconolaconase/LRE domain protein [Naasia sp.]
MTSETSVRSLGDERAQLGESPLWSADTQTLYWLDLLRPTLHSWSETAGPSARPLGLHAPLGPLVALPEPGRAITTDPNGVYAVELATGETRLVGSPLEHTRGVHVNDGKTNRDGSLWLSTSDDAETRGLGALYRALPGTDSFDLRVIDAGFAVGNGPAFSPDGCTLYFDDTAARRVLAYPLEGDEVGEPVTLITVQDGHPDGLTVDAEGCLWLAIWSGSRVARYSPEGELMREIPLPGLNVSSVTFGGADLGTLFVTTAWKGMSDEERQRIPGSGGAYAVDAGVRGIAETPWNRPGLARPESRRS